MRSLGTRRATLVAGVATVAAVALAGCSAGQVAETSLKRPSNMGVNVESSDNSVAVRNLAVLYNGSEGYPANGSAPLEVGLYNNTTSEITVRVSSQPLAGADAKQGVVSGRLVGLVGGTPSAPSTALPEPSGSRPAASPDTDTPDNLPDPSAEPSALPTPSSAPEDAAEPARITLGPLGYQTFLPGDKQSLQVFGLSGKLVPGGAVNLVFEFSNGADPLVVQAPMGIPLSPASRGPVRPEASIGEGEEQ
jgi:hypothetical protein